MIWGSFLENLKNILIPKGCFERHHVAVLQVLISLYQLRTPVYCLKGYGSFFLLFFLMGQLFSEPITWDVVIAAYWSY